ncbi:MAG: uracil phosphoribosyltransferase [Clostridia bacterium]|nr:uracil phosphoribosyltransferase [Clostridia bacterium]
MENKITVMDHPLIQHKISLLRDKNTGSKEFRELISEVTLLMSYEATRDLPLKEIEVETPIATAKTKVLAGRKLAFIPILRSGIGMMDGVTMLIPAAKVGHIGIFRDESTSKLTFYYNKMPKDISNRDVIVLDPMLATGETATVAIDKIKQYDPNTIKFMCIIASPEGVRALNNAHPDVQIYCAAIDAKTDENGYIVPGFGDAGDRIFGTN